MANLYSTESVTQRELLTLLRQEYGEKGAAFMRSIAREDDFNAYVKALKSFGYKRMRSSADSVLENTNNPYYREYDDHYAIRMLLVMRYPFLVAAKNPAKELLPAPDFLLSIPDGWRHRFGLELCEDTRTILNSTKNPRRTYKEYNLLEVKEKYGELNIYGYGSEEVYEDLENLYKMYGLLSFTTCIRCGTLRNVRNTIDWIAPLCFDCFYARQGVKEEDYTALAKTYARFHGRVPEWDSDAPRRPLMLRDWISVTETVDKILGPYFVTIYDGSSDSPKKKNIRKELEDKYPDLLVYKLMEDRDRCNKHPEGSNVVTSEYSAWISALEQLNLIQ